MLRRKVITQMLSLEKLNSMKSIIYVSTSVLEKTKVYPEQVEEMK